MKSRIFVCSPVLLTGFLWLAGCTDPTQPPMLVQIHPDPVIPASSPQNVDLLGSNLDADVYFLINAGRGEVLLEPQNVPGRWTFRCVFGFHFIYTFDSLRDFVLSQGSPSQLSVRAFNVGPNLVAEEGHGDDLPSPAFTWTLRY
jgi:hypothetical protein